MSIFRELDSFPGPCFPFYGTSPRPGNPVLPPDGAQECEIHSRGLGFTVAPAARSKTSTDFRGGKAFPIIVGLQTDEHVQSFVFEMHKLTV